MLSIQQFFFGVIAKQWIDADYDLRVRFQTMLFPEGTTFDMETRYFGTDKISPLYRYAPNKDDLSMKDKSSLVISRGRQHQHSSSKQASAGELDERTQIATARAVTATRVHTRSASRPNKKPSRWLSFLFGDLTGNIDIFLLRTRNKLLRAFSNNEPPLRVTGSILPESAK